MKKWISLFIIGIVLLFSFTWCSNEKNNSIVTDASKFKEEYEGLNGKKNESNGKEYRTLEIDEDNSFVYKGVGDIVQMIDEGETFIVYFGFASCPWCRSIIEPFMEAVDDLEIYPVYYVDIKEVRDTLEISKNGEVVTLKDGTEEYYQLLDRLDFVLEDYVLINDDGKEVKTGEKRIYAPNIVSIVNGEAVGLTDGVSDSQSDPYMELTEEMKEESYDKIKCSIECVVDNKEVCSAKAKC